MTGLITHSTIRNRDYERKFDHEDAKKRFAAGEKVADLAREYGVTHSAVTRVIDPATNEKMRLKTIEWIMAGVCVDCGREGITRFARTNLGPRCRECANRARATTVRTDELLCSICRHWFKDEAFPKSKNETHRRGRHPNCRRCCNEARTEYRNRHKIPCEGGCGNLVEGRGRPSRGGVDRPYLCRECWTESRRPGIVNSFVVLEEIAEDTWFVRGKFAVSNRSEALNKTFEGTIPEGRVVMVSSTAWKPGRVVPIQKLDIDIEVAAP